MLFRKDLSGAFKDETQVAVWGDPRGKMPCWSPLREGVRCHLASPVMLASLKWCLPSSSLKSYSFPHLSLMVFLGKKLIYTIHS